MPSNITRFLAFQEEQGGVLPPRLAAKYVGFSPQALLACKAKRYIAFMEVSGVTYYGWKSLRGFRSYRNNRGYQGLY